MRDCDLLSIASSPSAAPSASNVPENPMEGLQSNGESSEESNGAADAEGALLHPGYVDGAACLIIAPLSICIGLQQLSFGLGPCHQERHRPGRGVCGRWHEWRCSCAQHWSWLIKLRFGTASRVLCRCRAHVRAACCLLPRNTYQQHRPAASTSATSSSSTCSSQEQLPKQVLWVCVCCRSPRHPLCFQRPRFH